MKLNRLNITATNAPEAHRLPGYFQTPGRSTIEVLS